MCSVGGDLSVAACHIAWAVASLFEWGLASKPKVSGEWHLEVGSVAVDAELPRLRHRMVLVHFAEDSQLVTKAAEAGNVVDLKKILNKKLQYTIR